MKMWNMTAGGYDSSRPSWTPAQFTVDARSSFTIILEGQASNGGFAVDDIKTLPGTCESKWVVMLMHGKKKQQLCDIFISISIRIIRDFGQNLIQDLGKHLID
jgi:hypothetical protein